MENETKQDFTDSSPTDIFEIRGEPAVVINRLPPLPSTDPILICPVTDSQSEKVSGFGELLQGRGVKKIFGRRVFNGTITQFDEEMDWYRVVYEDGDFEDLEWNELMEVLVPLDVNIPLETLAVKLIKKRKKIVEKSVKSNGTSRNNGSCDGKGKKKGSCGS